ncbi:hypothetical protein [Streptomyces sp. NBC_00459]|uniref:hypothetical protein n=1 Tax=Streptomyces sp. NBC_00459 TaxID=2975749 RepID=UPI002E198634
MKVRPSVREAVADLGIGATQDLLRRAEEVTRFLPRLWQATEDILTSNPDITEVTEQISERY